MNEQEKILQQAAKLAKQQPQPHQQTAAVQPAPVPMSVQVAKSESKLVVIIIHHPSGQSVFFLDPDGADKIADSIKETARTIRTGIEVPQLRGIQ